MAAQIIPVITVAKAEVGKEAKDGRPPLAIAKARGWDQKAAKGHPELPHLKPLTASSVATARERDVTPTTIGGHARIPVIRGRDP